MTEGEEYACIHCNGVSEIKVLKETEKATEPMIEFCPFCGMSNEYPIERDNANENKMPKMSGYSEHPRRIQSEDNKMSQV